MKNDMNIKTSLAGSRTFILLLGLMMLLFACVDNKFIIDDYRRIPNSKATKNVVYFLPRIESKFATRTLSPFPAYCKVKIFAFNAYGTQRSISSPVYRSLEPGTLSPSQTPMTLINGTYDFYAVSLKEDSLPPTFTDNIAIGLENNKDYLWCGISDQMIDQNGTTIPITFNHVATQIVVNIVNQDTLNPVTSIHDAWVTNPQITNDVTWDLTTGVISPADTLSSTGGLMQINGLTTSYIMVPIVMKNGKLPYLAVVTLQEGETMSCNVDIPFPEAGYLSGRSYNYDLYFNADSIILVDAEVDAWNDVTVSTDIESDN